MTYRVRMLYLNQGEPPPSEEMDGTFDTVKEASDAGAAEALALMLRSVEVAYQVLDADGQIVEVPVEQTEG